MERNLYAGFASGVSGPGTYISKWDGTNWSDLGSPSLTANVWAVATNGTDLYAGGDFTQASGHLNANYIADFVEGVGDTTPPTVVSIVRNDTNPTSASEVSFDVSFSEVVTGVDNTTPFSDFSLNTSGVTGAAITAVTGSGHVYTVTVDTGSDNGTIGLDVNDNDNIVDLANNPLGGTGTGNGDFTAGEVYTVDKTPSLYDLRQRRRGWRNFELYRR